MNVACSPPIGVATSDNGSPSAMYPAANPAQATPVRASLPGNLVRPMDNRGATTAIGKMTFKSGRNPSPIETSEPDAAADKKIAIGRCDRMMVPAKQASAATRKGALEKS